MLREIVYYRIEPSRAFFNGALMDRHSESDMLTRSTSPRGLQRCVGDGLGDGLLAADERHSYNLTGDPQNSRPRSFRIVPIGVALLNLIGVR